MPAKTLRPHQEELLEKIRGSLRQGNRRVMAQAVTGFGKCLGLGTPVLLYDGRIVPIEQIQKHDVVMGPDSRPRLVLSTCRGTGPLYRITPVKGDSWVCNDVHVLTVVDSRTGRIEDVALDEFLTWSKSRQHYAKLFSPREGIEFPRIFDDPKIDPYFTGLWIGDGTKSLNGVAISKPDPEVLQACEAMAEAYGCVVRTDGKACPTHHIVTPRGEPNYLLRIMRAYLGDGQLPHEFTRASRPYRLELLAGILDADGHLIKETVFEVAQKSRIYADGIAFLARSIGLKVTEVPKVVNGETYHRLTIFGDTHIVPTRIPRKQARPRQQIKDPTRVGFTVEVIGEGEYAGFELTDDGRFMLGDFTVTHNTVVAISMIRNVFERGRRVIFVVPAVALINQTVERLAEEGIYEVGVIQANHELTNPLMPIQVASVQTLLNRTLEETCEESTRKRSVSQRDENGEVIFEDYTDKDTGEIKKRPKMHTVDKNVMLQPIPPADLVIVDEAHVCYEMHDKWMNHPRWQKVPFIGLSATPWTKGLGKTYDDLVFGKPMSELIEEGYLSPFRVFAPSHPDLSTVRIMAGDYHEGDLSDAMNKGHLVADVVDSWIKHADGVSTLCFCVDRAHAQAVQAQFRGPPYFVNAGYIDAFTPPEERKNLQRQFASGEIKVICNVGVLTTGVDWDVRCIILARPTRSQMLFVQIVGRGLRTAPGKEFCIILDHSDNHARMGFVTDIHFDALSTGEKIDKKVTPERKEKLPKECPQCHYVRAPDLKICPSCGFEAVKRSGVECEDGELVEIKAKKIKPRPSHAEMQIFYSMMLHHGRQKGMSDSWVGYRFKDKFGEWPKGLRDVASEPDEKFRSYIRHLNIKSAYGRKRQGSLL